MTGKPWGWREPHSASIYSVRLYPFKLQAGENVYPMQTSWRDKGLPPSYPLKAHSHRCIMLHRHCTNLTQLTRKPQQQPYSPQNWQHTFTSPHRSVEKGKGGRMVRKGWNEKEQGREGKGNGREWKGRGRRKGRKRGGKEREGETSSSLTQGWGSRIVHSPHGPILGIVEGVSSRQATV